MATAAVAARYGLACRVFMGTEDMRRQEPNVARISCWAPGRGVMAEAALKDATSGRCGSGRRRRKVITCWVRRWGRILIL